jgi:DNA-binding CsgD family transcriptional regulator
MGLMAPLFATSKALFFSVDRIHPRESVTDAIGLAPEYLHALRSRDLDSDFLWHAMVSIPAGGVFRSSELLPRDVLRMGPLYEQIAVPAGVQYVMGAILENNPSSFVDLSVARSDRDFCEAEKAQLAWLLPHLQTALALNRRIVAGDAGRREAMRSFDRARQPLVVLDRSGYALQVNDSAHRLLEKTDGMTLKFGRFLFDDVATQTEFEREVREAVARPVDDEEATQVRRVRVPRHGAAPPYGLQIVGVNRSDSRALMPDGAGCMVLIYDDESWRELPVERLAWLYRLTSAEARICDALFRFGSVESAAQALCLTRHTVRSHLKSIYTKFGVATQVQLMQRLGNSVRLTEGIDRREAEGSGTRS